MKRKLVAILLFSILASQSLIAYAGHNNQNGENGAQGTNKANHLDGCRPGLQSGNIWIFIPSDLPPIFTTNIWEGGPCCAAYSYGAIDYTNAGEGIYMPNQCCNAPDTEPGSGVPGNHCLCFMLRGWPIPNAL